MHVRARFTRRRHPVNGPNRFTFDENNTLVTVAHFRLIALRNHRFAEHLTENFQQAIEVFIPGLQVEDTRPTIAKQRFDNDIFMSLTERPNFCNIIADQGWRHDTVKMRNQQFFWRIPNAHRVIDHQCFGVNMLQNMRCCDVRHVKRRILAHQDHIHVPQIDHLRLTEVSMVAAFPAYRQGRCPRGHVTILKAKLLRQIMEQPIAPPLGFQRQDKTAVTININRINWVHLNGDVQCHNTCPLAVIEKCGKPRPDCDPEA